MVKNAKKFMSVASVCAIVGVTTLSQLPVSAQVVSLKGVEEKNENVFTPFATLSYSKTVTRFYKYLSQIPKSIQYQEYDSGTKVTMRGVLYLAVTTRTTMGYEATFTGELHGYV